MRSRSDAGAMVILWTRVSELKRRKQTCVQYRVDRTCEFLVGRSVALSAVDRGLIRVACTRVVCAP